MRYVLAAIIIVLMLGCAPHRSHQSKSVYQWEGQHVDSLVYGEWGYPDETGVAPNGNKLLIYRKNKTIVKKHLQYYRTRPKNQKFVETPYTVNRSTTTFFEVNDSDIIVNVHTRSY
jgi:hypothetical protein